MFGLGRSDCGRPCFKQACGLDRCAARQPCRHLGKSRVGRDPQAPLGPRGAVWRQSVETADAEQNRRFNLESNSTLPHRRAALHPLPAVCGVDAGRACSTARARLPASYAAPGPPRVSARTPPRRLGGLRTASSARPARAGPGPVASVLAQAAAPPVRPCRRPDPSVTYVEQNPPNVLCSKGFPAQLNITTNST